MNNLRTYLFVLALGVLMLTGLTNAALTVTLSKPSNTTVDWNQPITLIATSSGSSSSSNTFNFYLPMDGNFPTFSCGGVSAITTPDAQATCTVTYPSRGSSSYGVGLRSGGRTANSNIEFVNSSNVSISATILPSSTSATGGQSDTFTVNVIGGWGPFSAAIYDVANGTLEGTNTITRENPILGGGNGIVTFDLPVDSGTYTFNAIVTDLGTTSPYVFNTVTNAQVDVSGVTVLPPLSVTMSAASTTLTSGQSITLTATAINGNTPYTYTFFNTTSGSDAAISNCPTSSNTQCTFQTGAAGTFSYDVVVQDSTTPTGTMANSISQSITVNLASLSAAAPTPTGTTISSGGSVTLNANAIGGTGSYTYQWYNYSGNQSSTRVNIDNLRYNYAGGDFNNAQIILTFDGAWNSTFVNATPILAANNQAGVAFIVTNQIGENASNQALYNSREDCGVSSVTGNAVDCITVGQLVNLSAAGWDIGSHTADHTDLTANPLSKDEFELSNSFATLQTLGFGSTAQFLAYPDGHFNNTIISTIQSEGNYSFARTLGNGVSQPNLFADNPYGLNYKVQTISMVPSITPSDIMADVNQVIQQKGLFVLTFHIIQNNPNAPLCLASEDACYNTTDFATISNALAKDQQQGLLTVTTLSKYYNKINSGPAWNDWTSPGQGTLLDGMEAVNTIPGTGPFTNNWFINYGSPSADISVNTSPNSFVEGNGAVSFTVDANSTGGAIRRDNISWDLSTANNLYFWLYINNASDLNNLAPGNFGASIELANDNNYNSYFRCSIFSGSIQNGWNPLVIATSACASVNGANWNDPIVSAQFTISLNATQIPGQTGSTLTVSPKANTYYFYSVTDGSSSVTSPPTVVNVGVVPFAITAKPTVPTSVGLGRNIQVNATATGGSGVYTYSWTSSSCPGSAATGSGSSSTYTPNAITTNCVFTFTANDGSATKSASTAEISVSVVPALTTVSCPSFIVGQSTTCTATVSGFNPVGNVIFTTSDSTGSFTANVCTLSSGTCSVGYNDSASAGSSATITANYISTDSNNIGSINTTALSINSKPSSGGGGGGGGGGGSGGGGGGGGGGSSKPVVTNITNGYTINGISQLNTLSIVLCGTTLQVTENYISPTEAGVTINGQEYILTPKDNMSITGEGSGCSVELLNISYIPIQQSITLQFTQSTPIVQATTPAAGAAPKLKQINVSFAIGPSDIIKVNAGNYSSYVNISRVITTPQGVPAGYTVFSVFNVSVSNALNVSTINFTESFECGLTNLQPFIIQNGTWASITPFSVNSTACTITFQIPADPIVALTQLSTATTPILKQPVTTTVAPVIVIIPGPSVQNSSATNSTRDAVAAVLVLAGIMALIGGAYGNSSNKKRKKNAYKAKLKNGSKKNGSKNGGSKARQIQY